MTLTEAREILTAPRPKYHKEIRGDYITYSWKASTGPMVVELIANTMPANSYMFQKIPEQYQELLTVDENSYVYFYELRFGQRDSSGRAEDYTLTGTGNPTEILIGVLGAVEQFQREYHDFSLIEYSASGRGRVKSYNLLTKLMTSLKKLPFYIHDSETSHALYYVIVKDEEHTFPYNYIPPEEEESENEEDEEEEEEEEVTYYFMDGNCNADYEGDTEVTVSIYYYQMKKTGDDEEWEDDEGPFDFTMSDVQFLKVGKGVGISDSKTEFLYYLKKFNPMNGLGVIVNYINDITPENAYNNASRRWGNAEEGSDLDDYEVKKYLKVMFQPEEYLDYIIIKPSTEIDDNVKMWLENYFDFSVASGYMNREEGSSFDIMEDVDNEGNKYMIYYRLRYDYSKPAGRPDDQWASLPSQRRDDRQQDLPFGF